MLQSARAVALAILLSCVCVIRIVEGNAKFTCGFDPTPVIFQSDNEKYQAATLSQMDFSICDEIVLFVNIKYDPEKKSFYSHSDAEFAAKYDEIINEFSSDTFYSEKIKLISFGRDNCIGADQKDNYNTFLTIIADSDFAAKALAYAQEHKLDGFVMNYDIEGDNEQDKEKFRKFLSTIRDTFNQNSLLVYLIVATEKNSADDDSLEGWLALANSVDVMLLQTCFPLENDLNNGGVFPIDFVYPPAIAEICVGDECSVAETFKYLVMKGGLDKTRISIQVQLNCYVVSLEQGSANCVGTKVKVDLTGPVWGTAGYTTFDEMCFAKREQFFSSDAITSCTDRSVAAEITQYVLDNGMYGVFVYEMNFDDPQQYCDCGESFPISHAVRAVLDGTWSNPADCLYGEVNPFTKLNNECCPVEHEEQ